MDWLAAVPVFCVPVFCAPVFCVPISDFNIPAAALTFETSQGATSDPAPGSAGSALSLVLPGPGDGIFRSPLPIGRAAPGRLRTAARLVAEFAASTDFTANRGFMGCTGEAFASMGAGALGPAAACESNAGVGGAGASLASGTESAGSGGWFADNGNEKAETTEAGSGASVCNGSVEVSPGEASNSKLGAKGFGDSGFAGADAGAGAGADPGELAASTLGSPGFTNTAGAAGPATKGFCTIASETAAGLGPQVGGGAFASAGGTASVARRTVAEALPDCFSVLAATETAAALPCGLAFSWPSDKGTTKGTSA